MKKRIIPFVEIKKKVQINEELFLIFISKPTDFLFKPGQYVTLGINGIERAYSVVSAPYEDVIEIFVEFVPEGEMTPLLVKTEPGDKITMRPRAKGLFTLNSKFQNHVMVGTVTGIAPYVSIIRDTLHNNIVDNKFFVFQGASYIDEFAYDKELAEYAVRFPEFVKYFPTISRSKEKRNIGWKGIQGRVNDILGSHVEELNLFPDSTLIYTCGHPGMIEDVKSKFSKQGYKVTEERFWKE